MTQKKAANIRKRNSAVYFCIDDEKMPVKGVEGKGSAKILEKSTNDSLSIVKRIMTKYLGSMDHPIAQQILDTAEWQIYTIGNYPILFHNRGFWQDRNKKIG
jgi:hypothetical protein